ncbi:MAG: hypothetical protein DGJ47_000053 [Rickettsiaceae bacterium]
MSFDNNTYEIPCQSQGMYLRLLKTNIAIVKSKNAKICIVLMIFLRYIITSNNIFRLNEKFTTRSRNNV